MMQAGFAKINVTPPLGMPMEGLGQQGGIQAIRDDLFIRALYLSHHGEEVLIIGCDLLFFTRPQIDRLKGCIGRAVGLPPQRILINNSHNHSGPRMTPWAYTGDVNPFYFEQVEASFARVAGAAQSAQRPVTLWAGMTRTALPVSRRKIGADGKAEWAPSQQGAICDALPICVLKDAEDQVVCLLFSVSCHPSIWYELEITAEYPGVATRILNQHFNTEGSLFLQGTGGDTKPRQIAVEEDHWRHGVWEDIEAAGAEVAQAVTACIEAGLTPIDPDIRVCLDAMQWPFEAPPTREQLAEIAAQPDTGAGMRQWAAEMLARLDFFSRLPESLEVGIHAVQLGKGLRLIGLEGEAVGEIGQQILGAYPHGVTFPMGYTNATKIYLTTSHMRAEEGYEVTSFWELGHPAPLAVGMEQVLQQKLAELQAGGIDAEAPKTG
ncbi:MAG: hypothetical protein ACYDBB_16115 [Armatimonadota bacterium]